LQVLIGSLTNDPAHDIYTTADIGVELDNSMNEWNIDLGLIKETTTITTVTNQRQYLLSLITGTPIDFPRVTHKGIALAKRSKAYFDLYAGSDWTTDLGTPVEFCVEATDPANLYLTVHPTPQANDAGANLVVEAIIGHTSMSASTDVPYMLGATSNYVLRPYDWNLAYSVAARLLARQASASNQLKSNEYAAIARNGIDQLQGVFKGLEAETPKRMAGGRYWNSGNTFLLK
jgi:hypothetical protein